MQNTTLDIGTVFQPVEDALRNVFLPKLFKGDTSQIDKIMVNGLQVKQDSIALPDPTQTTGANWTAPHCSTTWDGSFSVRV